MAESKHVRLARWLVSKGFIDKVQAANALEQIEKQEAMGKTVSMIANLKNKGLLNKHQLAEIQRSQLPPAVAVGAEKKPSPPAVKVSEEDLLKGPTGALPEEAGSDFEETVLSDIVVVQQNPDLCPECHANIEENARECGTCGAEISLHRGHRCAACGRTALDGSMECECCGSNVSTAQAGPRTPRCRGCSRPLLPDEAFCLKCGYLRESKEEFSGFSAAPVLVLLLGLLGAYLFSYTREARPGEVGAVLATSARTERREVKALFEDVQALELAPFERNSTSPASQQLLRKALPLAESGKWRAVVDSIRGREEDLNVGLLNLWGRAAYESGDHRGLAALQKAFSREPYLQRLLGEVLLEEGARAVKEGRGERALACLDGARELGVQDGDASFWSGCAALMTGDSEGALKHFTDTVTGGDAWVETHILLAWLQRESARERCAEELNIFLKRSGVPARYKKLIGSFGL
ncbi:MAG: hypothetical protein HQL31_12155 [Planctomycetes bacterium]|nr:hypothetical protein [Planctomycetota bacterium]